MRAVRQRSSSYTARSHRRRVANDSQLVVGVKHTDTSFTNTAVTPQEAKARQSPMGRSNGRTRAVRIANANTDAYVLSRRHARAVDTGSACSDRSLRRLHGQRWHLCL